MANDSLDMIRLQLAMAFGQGAGAMLATPDALEYLLSEHGDILRRAARSWDKSRFAFVELMRVLGQLAAANAARSNIWEIQRRHVVRAMPAVMGPCPCFVPNRIPPVVSPRTPRSA